MMRRKLPQSRLGLRKKVGVYLDPEEQARLEAMAKQRSTSSSALIAGFIRDAIERESVSASSNMNEIENLFLTIMNRLSKLDRVGGALASPVLSHHVAYFSYHAVALTF
jgi:predicted DNA-binding protein